MTKFYIQLAVAAIVGIAILWGIGYVSRLQAEAAAGARATAALEAAVVITAQGAVDSAAQAASETAVITGREQFTINITEGRKNEADTAVRAERVVPLSVRDAFHTRRLTRERIDSERGTESPATTAAQR